MERAAWVPCWTEGVARAEGLCGCTLCGCPRAGRVRAEVFGVCVCCLGRAALVGWGEGEGDVKSAGSQEHVTFLPALLMQF